MPDDLYDRDVLIWAEQQADLLRRLSVGERVNAEVDWPHVIEELRDVGLSELHACQNLLRQALIHLLKAHGWPEGPTEHWIHEAETFLDDMQTSLTPSMRHRLDVAALYARALRRVRSTRINGRSPRPLPTDCPFPLDALLAPDADVSALLLGIPSTDGET